MARRKKSVTKAQKTRRPESLEAREVMSATPLLSGAATVPSSVLAEAPVAIQPADYDFRIDQQVLLGDPGTNGGRVEQTLNDAHALTGLDSAAARYGFDGSGQTVAVIDSGIAYRHFALGGGLGADYRVVGGYDFAEGDADPYDDGPTGSHGTHVAGIVGAAGGTHEGVAPGVDLVGLRVFDDEGNGFFHWVEQALQWVHDNRDTFENPITAVNLSLGTDFNGTGIPGWATLEDEFAQLEADGIFISVSAGNSYQNFSENGLSYPAASPHVVPVLATNDDGSLAFFSQRHARGIAAPGRFITSTVPDYAANDADSIDDDYLSFSGTSQAAPYVAGASVLIREAFEFVGRTDLDQWDIYDHIVSTADVFFDPASQTSYNRLNIERAIDAILPEDDFGSTRATAHNLGVLSDSSVVSGVVTTLDDADYFSFIADVTGTVTVEAANITHSLDVQWSGDWTINPDGSYTLDVVAGQSYTFGLSSSEGLGYYDLSLSLEATRLPAIDLGTVDVQQTFDGQAATGEQWFRVVAGRSGFFTAEAFGTGDGSTTIALFDAQENLLASGIGRADGQANAGQELLIRVSGDTTSFDLRTTNAFGLFGGVATLVGTVGDDTISFSAGDTHEVGLNGVNYAFAASRVEIDTGAGVDTYRYTGGVETENAIVRVGSSRITSSSYQVDATGYQASVVVGQNGDTAQLLDGANDDRLVGGPTSTSLYAVDGSFSNTVTGFSRVEASSTSGSDSAYLSGSAARDIFSATATQAFLRADNGAYDNRAFGFDRVFAYAGTGGDDVAYLADSAGNDVLTSRSDYTLLRDLTGSYYNYAAGFSRVHASATNGGNDFAHLFDSESDDVFLADSARSTLRAVDLTYSNTAENFDRVFAYSTAGGSDKAYFTDSAGGGTYTNLGQTALATDAGNSYYNSAIGFSQAYGYSTTEGDAPTRQRDSQRADTLATSTGANPRDAADHASLYVGTRTGLFKARSAPGVLSSFDSLSYRYARGVAYAPPTADPTRSDLTSSPENDSPYAGGATTTPSGITFQVEAHGFDTVGGAYRADDSSIAKSDADDLDGAFEQFGLVI